MLVGVRAEHQSAYRSHQESSAESHQRKHQRGKCVSAGEKRATDGRGVVAKDHEVVHLEKISARDPNHRPDFRFVLRRGTHLGLLYRNSFLSSMRERDNLRAARSRTCGDADDAMKRG